MPPKGGFFNDGREQALHDYVFSLPQENLKGNPQAVLDAINNFTSSKSRMMVFQPHKLDISRKILQEMDPKPKIFVELGSYVGNSAVAWGAMLKEFHSDDSSEGCKVYSCELDAGLAKIARDFVELAGLSDVIEIVEGKSSDSIKLLKDEGKIGCIDVLFLDHWESYYLPDLQLCEDLGLLRKGSIVLADNTDMPGAPDYVKYVKAGGRGNEGGMKLDSKTYQAEGGARGPNVVEATTIVEVP